MKLSIMIFHIMTLIIIAFHIMTISRTIRNMKLSITTLNAKCRYSKCHYVITPIVAASGKPSHNIS